MRAGIFPGESSDFQGMSELIAHSVFDHFDPGFDIRNIDASVLEDRLKAQLAIFSVSAILWDEFRRSMDFSLLAGHSLGFYSALYAARAIGREEGLYLIRNVFSAIREVSSGLDGGMSAIIGLKSIIINGICRDIPGAYVANVNSATQSVISGTREALEEAEKRAVQEGALMVRRLAADAPLHSPLMEGICGILREKIKFVKFRTPEIPVADHTGPGVVTDTEKIKTIVCEQLTRKVLWLDSINLMCEKGAEEFVEVGPSDVLSKLVKWIRRDVRAVSSAEIVEKRNGKLPGKKDVKRFNVQA